MAFDTTENIFKYTLSITSNESDTYIISDYAPLKLEIDLSGIETNNKIKNIKYIWGDEKETIVNYNLKTNESPKYDIQNKKYFITDNKITEQNVKIKVIVYFFNTQDTIEYVIDLTLKKPNLNDFFESFKLIKTRMFGPNNTLIYVFETKNPDSILMSTVNWEMSLEKTKTESLPPVRFYQFLPAIENRFTGNIPKNKDIDVIPYQISNNNTPSNNIFDKGGNIL